MILSASFGRLPLRLPFVLVICSEDTDVPETERFIREIALELYQENGIEMIRGEQKQ